MDDVFHQSTAFREKSAEYRARANAAVDRELGERFDQLATRYLDIAVKLEGLAIGTAVVHDLEQRLTGSRSHALASA